MEGMKQRVSLAAFPMHGQHKLSTEGYRTRDGHLIEWFGRLLEGRGPVGVVSRPEPAPIQLSRRFSRGHVAANTVPIESSSWRLPNLKDRQKWWVGSAKSYPSLRRSAKTPVVVWNPFVSMSSAWEDILASGSHIHLDLLDDWTVHFAFKGIHAEVTEAYKRLFDASHTVSANAEGTRDLAVRFGRPDVEFLANGVDPGRFKGMSRARGPLTVGYVGKIGKRVDLELILSATRANLDVNFIFAGPILDAEYRAPLADAQNIELLGDVHYDDVPALLQRFDLGWIPHRVGEGEVGGDVIKTYEYRAAGLQVLATPFAGVRERGFDATVIEPASRHGDLIRLLSQAEIDRVPRIAERFPEDMTWEYKAKRILQHVGLA